MRLAVSVPFHDGESFLSYCARTAVANGTGSLKTFSRHMGIPFRSIFLGEMAAVDRVAGLTGEDPKVLASGLATRRGSEFTINGELITQTFLNRARFRFCPACLREDEATGTGPFASRPYGRLRWEVTFVRSCARHGTALAVCEKPLPVDQRHEFSLAWSLLSPEEKDAWCPVRPKSAFERYMVGRLGGGSRSNGWLDEMPYYVAGHICELVGAARLFGKWFKSKRLSDLDLAAGGEAGFAILGAGKEGFAAFLTELQEQFLDTGQNHYLGQALYGTLYRRLESNITDMNYDCVRDFIRRHAVATLPFGPEDIVFEPLRMPRRLHSIKTASVASGLGVKMLRSKLVHLGILSREEAARTPHRVFIEASKLDFLIAECAAIGPENIGKATLNENEAAAMLGVGQQAWTQLVKAFQFRDRAYARVSRRRIEEFLVRLKEAGTGVNAPEAELLSPSAAVATCQCRLIDVLNLVLDGRLGTVGFDRQREGINCVLVDPIEVSQALHAVFSEGYFTSIEAAEHLQISTAVLTKVALLGVLPRHKRPGGGRQFMYAKSEVVDFGSHNASIRRIAAAAGISTVAVVRLLDRRSISPSFGGAKLDTLFYPLHALQGVFGEHVIARLR